MANRKISDFSLLTTATGLEQVSLIFGNQNYRMTLNTFKSILTKQDVGLGNVSNTSDADKPVSTAVLTALLSKADVNHTHTLAINDIPGLMTALAGKSNFGHTHVSSEISGLDLSLAGKAALGHTHAIDDISLLAQTLSMKAETGHVHDMTTIAGLSAALAGKAAVSHIHDMSSIPGLTDSLSTMQTSLAGKSAIGHGHAIVDISGLSTTITDLQIAVTNLQAGGGGGINVAGTGLLKITNNILTLAAAGTDYMSPSAENSFTKPQKVSTTNKVQPASGTVSWDLDTHQVIRIELTSNVTNFNIQNLDLTRIGFDYKVVIIHKGGDLVFPANVKFPDGAAPALTLVNNKIDTFSFMVESFDGVTPYLYCVGYALNM